MNDHIFTKRDMWRAFAWGIGVASLAVGVPLLCLLGFGALVAHVVMWLFLSFGAAQLVYFFRVGKWL